VGKKPRERQTAKPGARSMRNQIPVAYHEVTDHFVKAGTINPGELRQKTLKSIEELTGRPILCYVAKTLENPHFVLPTMTPLDEATSIDDNDMLGFTDLIESTPGNVADVLLVSNGGSPLAAERIVRMLRQKFTHIRFIIPANAFSAATMICFSGDEILMNAMSSTLGPIDPQITGVPVRAVIRGLEEIERRYKEEGQVVLDIYSLLIAKYSLPGIETCKSALGLATELSKSWLTHYMFRKELAEQTMTNSDIDCIVTTFLNYDEHKDHGRSIDRAKARDFKLRITNIEDTPGLNDLVRSLYNQYEKWFELTTFFKMYENTRGVSWGRQSNTLQVTQSSPEQQSAIVQTEEDTNNHHNTKELDLFP
jgi:Serine dehydrogenase proteinase